MRKNNKIALGFLLAVLLPLCALLFYALIKDYSNRCTIRARDSLLYGIFQETAPFIQHCQQKPIKSESITVRGEVLIWHVPVDSTGLPICSSYYHGDYKTQWTRTGGKLPEQSKYVLCDSTYSRISSRNAPATVFIILHSGKKRLVGRYSYHGTGIDAGPAVSEEVDVCVVYWPEKSALGCVTIQTKPPIEITYGRDEFGRVFGGAYGGRTIEDWIYSLKKE